ncbi:MAG: hypothetical protein ACNYPE_15565 [Candidatus Azotimanducaceae bacterium WSBS_2022_MAG_OTU7]
MLSINAISGYSGGGRQLIEKYESEGANRPARPYSLALRHKHVPEMTQYAGLSTPPAFHANSRSLYNGMLVSVPLLLRTNWPKPTASKISISSSLISMKLNPALGSCH